MEIHSTRHRWSFKIKFIIEYYLNFQESIPYPKHILILFSHKVMSAMNSYYLLQIITIISTSCKDVLVLNSTYVTMGYHRKIISGNIF